MTLTTNPFTWRFASEHAKAWVMSNAINFPHDLGESKELFFHGMKVRFTVMQVPNVGNPIFRIEGITKHIVYCEDSFVDLSTIFCLFHSARCKRMLDRRRRHETK